MAPFTTATLPLQSCRMFSSLPLARRRPPVHGDRAGLGTTVETDAAAGAVMPGVARGMHTIGAQLRRQLQALRRTAVHAQSAALALLDVNRDFPACLRCHSHLVP